MSDLDRAIIALLEKINPWVLEYEREKWIGGKNDG